MVGQLNLNLVSPDPPRDDLNGIRKDLRFVVETVAEILDSLPVQRRPLSESTKTLHLRVTAARRNGYCPCCQAVEVCTSERRADGAEFDHFFGRNKPGPTETWLVCSSCNRALENADFKTAKRSLFEAYQAAVKQFLESGQPDLFG